MFSSIVEEKCAELLQQCYRLLLDLEKISKKVIAMCANDDLYKINILINDKDLSKKISNKASNIFNKRIEVNLCEIITKIIYTKWQTVI